MLAAVVGLACCWSSNTALGWGKYNKTLSVGDKAPAFAELPGADGKDYSSADFDKAKVLVVVFTCNSCPYAVDYEDRLIDFQKRHAQGGVVALVAINCNLVALDSLENMTKRAKDKGFTFPYLFDKSQAIAREFGAMRTPECFVLNSQREIVYMGGFDDSPQVDGVKEQYVETAVQHALKGTSPDITETLPVGCMIRFKPKRD